MHQLPFGLLLIKMNNEKLSLEISVEAFLMVGVIKRVTPNRLVATLSVLLIGRCYN